MKQVIYIPGLGDQIPHGQRIITKFWRLYGLDAHYFKVGWADGEPFAPKLERLLAKIDELQKGGDVALVGISAGGSAVINALAQRPNLKTAVIVCGKNFGYSVVNPHYFSQNPAFEGSLKLADKNLPKIAASQRRRLLSLYCRHDR